MKVRIKFSKTGVMKFIGHLDMMRYFQKAMRRADIDIAYSTGFSPHQIMSFAAPLGVGLTSDGEYLDIEVHSSKSTKDSLKALNDTMVEGIEITEYKVLPDGAKTSMSIVAAAEYEVYFKENIPGIDINEMKQKVYEFYHEQEEIIVTKQTKKSEKEINLKEFIYSFDVVELEDSFYFSMICSAGSVSNIKPEFVMEHFLKFANSTIALSKLQFHRKEVYYYDEEQKEYLSLGSMGEDLE